MRKHSPRVVLLAGGEGTRLRPYTTVFPKPLVPLGDVPIMELVIRQLARNGMKDIVVAVGHLSELIMAFFGDGGKFGVRIRYSKEQTRMGTAGPLSLLKGELEDTFILMNGDVLCDIDFSKLVMKHRRSQAAATVAVTGRHHMIDYGMVETGRGGELKRWREKPFVEYTVSMGIYVLEPCVTGFLCGKKYLDLPDLITRIMKSGQKVNSYVHRGFWLDVGRAEDYERALQEAPAILKKVLGKRA